MLNDNVDYSYNVMETASHYETNVLNKRTTAKESELQTVEWEKKYKKFEDYKLQIERLLIRRLYTQKKG